VAEAALNAPMVRRDSDAELLQRRFRISDPLGVANLVDDLPADKALKFTIYGAYNVTPGRGNDLPKVRCAHCRAARHWKGVVLEFETGQRVLIGRDCAREHYAAQYELVEREFDAAETRQFYLRRLIEIRDHAFAPALAAISAVRQSMAVRQYAPIKVALRDGLPTIYENLWWMVTRHGGSLVVEEKVRDHAAEQARDRRVRADKDERDAPIYRIVQHTMGRVSGHELFMHKPDPADTVARMHESLKERWHELRGLDTNECTTGQLNRLLKGIAADLAEIDEALIVAAAPSRFFEPGNLSAIMVWANRLNPSSAYRLKPGKIVYDLGQYKWPEILPIPDMAGSARLRAALIKAG
jgi:hypothetical protein